VATSVRGFAIGIGLQPELDCGVYHGGTTFTGGRGNLFGTAAGVALLIMLLNLVVVLGLPIHWQLAMQGFVLVVAVALQGFRQFLLSR